MIETVVVVVLAAVGILYVGRPLLGGPEPEVAALDEVGVEASARKRAALVAILDLEAERDAGKLSAADFESLRAEYESEAVTALRDLDNANNREADDLEAEIAAVRARFECPTCGAVRSPGKTCPQCGG